MKKALFLFIACAIIAGGMIPAWRFWLPVAAIMTAAVIIADKIIPANWLKEEEGTFEE